MIRVLIADDQDLVRAGLRMILEAADELDVVAEAADGDAAVELAVKYEPDVVLMDIRMPRCDGIQATRRLVATTTPPKVIVLTTFDTDDNVYDALAAGARGFLLKTPPPAQTDRRRSMRSLRRSAACAYRHPTPYPGTPGTIPSRCRATPAARRAHRPGTRGARPHRARQIEHRNRSRTRRL
jgi:CheY-like chemotaxis protein